MYPNNDVFSQFRVTNKSLGFQQRHNAKRCKNKQEINTSALAGSVVGTLIPMIIIGKKQNTSFIKIAYEFKEMIFVGTGAILGGLTFGIIKDKKEKMWNKIKEANFQWITNLFLPTLFVDQLIKYADKKFPEQVNNKIVKAAAIITGIGAGMKIGEILTDKLNYCIDKNHKCKRNVNAKDVLLHIDDIPIALTLSKVPYVDKLLPFCFIFSGYQAGKA